MKYLIVFLGIMISSINYSYGVNYLVNTTDCNAELSSGKDDLDDDGIDDVYKSGGLIAVIDDLNENPSHAIIYFSAMVDLERPGNELFELYLKYSLSFRKVADYVGECGISSQSGCILKITNFPTYDSGDSDSYADCVYGISQSAIAEAVIDIQNLKFSWMELEIVAPYKGSQIMNCEFQDSRVAVSAACNNRASYNDRSYTCAENRDLLFQNNEFDIDGQSSIDIRECDGLTVNIKDAVHATIYGSDDKNGNNIIDGLEISYSDTDQLNFPPFSIETASWYPNEKTLPVEIFAAIYTPKTNEQESNLLSVDVYAYINENYSSGYLYLYETDENQKLIKLLGSYAYAGQDLAGKELIIEINHRPKGLTAFTIQGQGDEPKSTSYGHHYDEITVCEELEAKVYNLCSATKTIPIISTQQCARPFLIKFPYERNWYIDISVSGSNGTDGEKYPTSFNYKHINHSSITWGNTDISQVRELGIHKVEKLYLNTLFCEVDIDILDVRKDPALGCKDKVLGFTPKIGVEYILSAWVKEEHEGVVFNYSDATIQLVFVDGTNTTDLTPQIEFHPSGNIIDGWQRIDGKFIIPPGTTDLKFVLENESNKIFYFDDIRIHPSDASMKSFVYDPVTKLLMATLDENNYATLYEYDEQRRVVRVKRETERGMMTVKESHHNILNDK